MGKQVAAEKKKENSEPETPARGNGRFLKIEQTEKVNLHQQGSAVEIEKWKLVLPVIREFKKLSFLMTDKKYSQMYLENFIQIR